MEVLYAPAIVVVALIMVVAYQRATFGRRLNEAVRSHMAGEAERTGRKVQESLNVQRGVVKGKVWEQIAPYLPEFEYNPADGGSSGIQWTTWSLTAWAAAGRSRWS